MRSGRDAAGAWLKKQLRLHWKVIKPGRAGVDMRAPRIPETFRSAGGYQITRWFVLAACALFLAGYLSLETRAAAGSMTIEMTADIPLSYDSSKREFAGSGYLRPFAEDKRAHRIINIGVPQTFTMNTPAGSMPAPDDTKVTVNGTLSARAGAHNRSIMPEEGGAAVSSSSTSDVYIEVRLPLTDDFTDYGSGSYELNIPLVFTMEAAYGSYSKDYAFTPWEKLCETGKVMVDESGSMLQEVNVVDMMLEIPPGITEISGRAFLGADCKEVTIPASVKTADEAFMESDTECVAFDPGRAVIPKGICKNAQNLIYAIIPAGVTTLEESAFHDCESLKEPEFPESLTTLGAYCLHGCLMIKSFEISKNLTVTAYSAAGAPLGGSGIEEIIIKEGVTEIPSRLYSGAAELKYLYLPKSLRSIGGQAFSGATSLRELTLRSDINSGTTRSPFEGSGLQRIIIADGVTAIPANFFSGACDSLEEIYLPASINKIGKNAFRDAEYATVYFGGSEEEWDNINTGGWEPFNVVFGVPRKMADSAAVTPVTGL